MRYLILAILLVGCGPGPKSARGDDKPAAPKETYTQAVERFEKTVAGLAETQGNTNGELSAIEQRLSNVEKKLGKIENLLSLPAEISIEVPKAVEPTVNGLQLDAPPAEAADRRITFHGDAINVAEWLATPLTSKTRIGVGTRDTGNRAMVESHLRDHGLEGDFSKYSREQLITLHSVCHMKDGSKPVKSERTKTVVQAIIPPIFSGVAGCPNGQCQRPATTYYYSRSRRR